MNYQSHFRPSGGGSSKSLTGTGTKNLELRVVTPSKTRRLWPICLLPMDNFASFLSLISPPVSLFFLLFVFLLGRCPPHWTFRGPPPPLSSPVFRPRKLKENHNYCWIEIQTWNDSLKVGSTLNGRSTPFIVLFQHYLQHYSGTTITTTEIQLYLCVHRQVCSDKISSIAVKSYSINGKSRLD